MKQMVRNFYLHSHQARSFLLRHANHNGDPNRNPDERPWQGRDRH